MTRVFLQATVPYKNRTFACGDKKFNHKCGSSRPMSRPLHILNSGERAYPNEWPRMLHLTVKPPDLNGTVNCAAVLVQVCKRKRASDIAITAAHCVAYYDESSRKALPVPAKDVLVMAGLHDVQRDRKAYVKVTAVFPHPKYQEGAGLLGDFARLKLEKPFVYNDTIEAFCLPFGKGLPTEDDVCYIAGWGASKFILYSKTYKVHIFSHPSYSRDPPKRSPADP